MATSDDLPLEERRERLEALLDERQKIVQISELLRRRGGALRGGARAGSRGRDGEAEGSRYLEGKRTRDWLKIKTHHRQEFVICGYTKGQGRRSGGFGSSSSGCTGATSSCGSATAARVRRARDRRAAREARAARHQRAVVRGGPEDAEGAQGRRRVGEAGARVRGRVRRVDARRPPARAGVPGAARGQVGARGASRGSASSRSRAA